MKKSTSENIELKDKLLKAKSEQDELKKIIKTMFGDGSISLDQLIDGFLLAFKESNEDQGLLSLLSEQPNQKYHS